jgi:tight adherence protein B
MMSAALLLSAATAVAVVVAGTAARPVLAPTRAPVDGDRARRTRHARRGRLLPTSTRRRSTRRNRATVAPRAVADWCDDLARELRAGSSIRRALATTAPVEPRLHAATAPLRHAAERGAAIAEATLPCPGGGPHTRLALVVIAAVADLGGAPAIALDRVAATLRARAADADERAVQAAQARLSGQVLTALPIGMLALLAATDADVRAAVATPIGAACVAAGIALNTVGWWWIRAITRGVAS